MRRILTLIVLPLLLVGCQKAKESERINPDRSNGLGLNATQTPSGITLNGFVNGDSSQANFQDAVFDFMEGSIDPRYVGDVSYQAGTNNTGVYVGGKVELANGQPIGNYVNGQQSISATSELLVSVYDRFDNQPNLGPLAPVYLKQSSGVISGNNVDIKFWDDHGWVRLTGSFDSNDAKLVFTFKTDRTFDGTAGNSGRLGILNVKTCQFFRCH